MPLFPIAMQKITLILRGLQQETFISQSQLKWDILIQGSVRMSQPNIHSVTKNYSHQTVDKAADCFLDGSYLALYFAELISHLCGFSRLGSSGSHQLSQNDWLNREKEIWMKAVVIFFFFTTKL